MRVCVFDIPQDLDATTLMHLLGYIPPWVSFPDMMRVTWANVLLEKLWPFIDRAGQAYVKTLIEPMLNDPNYKPSAVSSISFTSFTLGTLPPKLRGVKVYASEQQSKEVVIEVDIAWGGNQNIALKFIPAGAVGYLFAAEVGIADMIISARARITLKPLIAELPCFGALEVSLVSRPDIDFDLKVLGGDLLSIPGLGSWIHSFVEEVLADMIVQPKKLIVPMVDNLDGMYPQGLWICKLVEAKNLPRADWFGYSDPYARLAMSHPPYIAPGEETVKTQVRTKTIFNTLSPVWDQVFSLVVHDPKEQYVTINVYDYDTGGSDDLLGSARIDLKRLLSGELYDDWITLTLPDKYAQRIRKRHQRLKRAGLTSRKTPPEVQIHIKHVYNTFGRTPRATDDTAAGDHAGSSDESPYDIDEEDQISEIRSASASSNSEFASLRHGLLSLTIIKAKVTPKSNGSSIVTYVPFVGAAGWIFEKDYYYVTVRVVQVNRYRNEPSSPARWQPARLYTRNSESFEPVPPASELNDSWEDRDTRNDDDDEDDDQGVCLYEDEKAETMIINEEATASYPAAGRETNTGDADQRIAQRARAFTRQQQSFNLGVANSRRINKSDVLFASKTTLKRSDVELRWDETFEYVLSENEFDDARQANMATPKAVVVQFLLNIRDQFSFRKETIGVVNVPLSDVLASRHIERQYNVIGARGNTTLTAQLNWQSF